MVFMMKRFTQEDHIGMIKLLFLWHLYFPGWMGGLFRHRVVILRSMDELGFFASFFEGYGMISAGFIVYAAVNNLFFIIQTHFIN